MTIDIDISRQHPNYRRAAPWWRRCRDLWLGSDAVKARGPEYLPRPEGMSPREGYAAYLLRALLYPAFARTVQALTGSVFRRPPVVTAPERLIPHLNDLDGHGHSLAAVARMVLTDLLVGGRVALLVDMAHDDETNHRPYWVVYGAERVLDWKIQPVNGVFRPTRVTLQEFPEELSDTREQAIEQIRELALENDRLVVRLWRRTGEARDRWQLVDEIVPLRRGEPLHFVPITMVGAHGPSWEVDKPPLLDLVDVNLSHFRTSADLEHGRHYVALPTPYVTGAKVETPLRIGSSTAWTLPEPEAKVGMLEFTGQGLGALERALEQKERMMAVLGARVLESQPRQAETAEAVRLRHSGDWATLRGLALALSDGMTEALRVHAWWAAVTDDPYDARITAALNTDFDETRLTPEQLKALVFSWQAGAISWTTLYHNLQQGEIARPGVAPIEERHEMMAADTGLTADDALDAAATDDDMPTDDAA